jgi:glycine C-acetyltransferase
VITSPQSNAIGVTTSSMPVLNFCANNYLGLANHPALVAAAKATLDTHGFGMSSVRFICGTQDIHKELERRIAAFHGTEDAILFPSCFDANAGFFEALFGPEDAVISDALNHASIIDGIRLCKAKRLRYAHMDMGDLEKQLQEAQSSRFRCIVTDGVFSMDGHIAPLKQICDLADKYNAYVFIDECHATGFFGKTGRGTAEYCGVEGRIDFINSTLGKALGGATGGYTAASKEVVSLLRQRARPYLFSNAVAPSVAGASLACFDLLTSSTELRDKLEANTQRFRKGMESAGFDLGGSKDHPIIPVMLGDAKLAGQFAEEMLKRGIYVVGFSFPVVPKGQARIRTQISAAHTTEDIDRAVAAFIEVKKLLIK